MPHSEELSLKATCAPLLVDQAQEDSTGAPYSRISDSSLLSPENVALSSPSDSRNAQSMPQAIVPLVKAACTKTERRPIESQATSPCG